MAAHTVLYVRSSQYLDKRVFKTAFRVKLIARMLCKMNTCVLVFNLGPPGGEVY